MHKTILILSLIIIVLLVSSCDDKNTSINISQRNNVSEYDTSKVITQKQTDKNEQVKESIVIEEEEKKSVNETKYLIWYEKEDEYVNFNHPYVKWLIDGKGNGSFNLNLNIKYNISQELVNKELSKLGILDHFRCYDSQEKCSVYLEITDFEIIKKLFSYTFIEDVHISHIVSDYRLNMSLEEMKKCDVDEDCQRVGTGCCSSANCNFEAINKEYVDLWNTQIYCHGIGCAAVMCMKTFYVNCIEGQCTLTQDTCFDEYKYTEHGAYLIKFKENTSDTEVSDVLNPLYEIEPKLNYKIEFSFDIYTFSLPKNKTDYTCNYDYIWCYVESTDKFINYVNYCGLKPKAFWLSLQSRPASSVS